LHSCAAGSATDAYTICGAQSLLVWITNVSTSSTWMLTWRFATANKYNGHTMSAYRFKLHSRSTMFGAWTLCLTVCPMADESNTSLWLMISDKSVLILPWTLEFQSTRSQGFWIKLLFLEATQFMFAKITGRNSQVERSWLGPLWMTFATFWFKLADPCKTAASSV
jgi:hypothetical protein